MAWTDTGLKTCILPAVLTLNPLRMKNKRYYGEKSGPLTTLLPDDRGRPTGDPLRTSVSLTGNSEVCPELKAQPRV